MHRRTLGIVEDVFSRVTPNQSGGRTDLSFNTVRIPVCRNGYTSNNLRGPAGTSNRRQPSRPHPHGRPSPTAGPVGNGPQVPHPRMTADLRRGRRCSEGRGTLFGHRTHPIFRRYIAWLGLDLLEYESDL